ncbi:hypothetical protein [Sulfurovum sp.]|nr:hypothetical protein [Sulfurovum sp.]
MTEAENNEDLFQKIGVAISNEKIKIDLGENVGIKNTVVIHSM